MNFQTSSPINVESLTGQNKKTFQLEIEIPIEATASNNYANALAEFRSIDKDKYSPVFFCYGSDTKKFFVSKFTSRHGIGMYKTIKIIE